MVSRQMPLLARTENEQRTLDEQIQQLQKIVDYEIREYPVEILVDKFVTGLETDEAELFIPDYQREFIWSKQQQSRFIESILLNLPIPYLFVADVHEGAREGRLEIVDGSQRIRTLVAFMQDSLRLSGLVKLDKANGFVFSEMSVPRQMRFKRKTLRTIELTESTDEEARREIFDRLNSGGTQIKPMEQRRGSMDGPFMTVLEECAALELFAQLCPVSTVKKKLQEPQELVLRYFAYCDQYEQFSKNVDGFLDDFLKQANQVLKQAPEKAADYRGQFETMLAFVAQHFPHGFKKDINNQSVPRIRFESIAIGATLALRANPELVPDNVMTWLESADFKRHTRSDASNSRPKLVNRIHFVRDSLLGRPIEYIKGGLQMDADSNEEA